MSIESVIGNIDATRRSEGVGLPSRPRRAGGGDKAFFALLTGAALIAPAILVLFIGVLAYGAWPSIKTFGLSFLTSSVWEPHPDREQYGALSFVFGTLVSSLLALCLAGPAAIAVATFINEVLTPRLRGIARFMIEILATIPSVVYGLWGVFVLAPWVRSTLQPILTGTLGFLPIFSPPYDPRNMLCAILILAVMILPMPDSPEAVKTGFTRLSARCCDLVETIPKGISLFLRLLLLRPLRPRKTGKGSAKAKNSICFPDDSQRSRCRSNPPLCGRPEPDF